MSGRILLRVVRTVAPPSAPPIVAVSEAMRAVVAAAERAARSDAPVLVEGETGVGKELVARLVHAAGPRASGPWVPVNCGALDDALVARELFGHARGAFTGALESRPGFLEAAQGGTLFLDEVGELTDKAQAMLLRALDGAGTARLGETHARAQHVRFVSATNRDLGARVEAGRFRRDLLFRIRGLRIPIPPLRRRPEDIPALALHFLAALQPDERRARGFEPEAMKLMLAHDWPGNARELRNAVSAALANAPGELVRPADLPEEIGGRRGERSGTFLSLRGFERLALVQALRQTHGRTKEAARLLGLGRSTMYRKMAEHGLGVSRKRDCGSVRSPGSGTAQHSNLARESGVTALPRSLGVPNPGLGAIDEKGPTAEYLSEFERTVAEPDPARMLRREQCNPGARWSPG
jgi:DNA-binding NtrC family response regulator